MTNRIELFSYAQSPYAAKVQACLNAKELNFTVHYVNPIKVKKELAFSGQIQIPVVRCGDVVMNDSTPICLWLDKNFPASLHLVPEQEDLRKRVLEIDHWVSEQLIPSSFKLLVAGPPKQRRHNFWRLADTLNQTVAGGLNPLLRMAWPWLVPKASFLKQMIERLDKNENAVDMRERMYRELSENLDGKPFLVEGNTPSLADLAAYPQLVNGYASGLDGVDGFLKYPELVAWLIRVSQFAESKQPLLPARCKQRRLPN